MAPACLASDIADWAAQVDRVDGAPAFALGVGMGAGQSLTIGTVDQSDDIRWVRVVEYAMLPGPIGFIPSMPHEMFQAMALLAALQVAEPGG